MDLGGLTPPSPLYTDNPPGQTNSHPHLLGLLYSSHALQKCLAPPPNPTYPSLPSHAASAATANRSTPPGYSCFHGSHVFCTCGVKTAKGPLPLIQRPRHRLVESAAAHLPACRACANTPGVIVNTCFSSRFAANQGGGALKCVSALVTSSVSSEAVSRHL